MNLDERMDALKAKAAEVVELKTQALNKEEELNAEIKASFGIEPGGQVSILSMIELISSVVEARK